MSLYDLLPPNSTQLERDLSRAVSFLPKLQGGPPTIRTAKRRNIPATVLPWLVYEYGLGEVSPYIPDLNELIVQGVAWQRIRGTPASIAQAISWLGLNATIDESEAGSYRWSEFQVGLPAATTDANVRSVVRLAELSSPVRSRLQRIFAVYDFRRFVLDDSTLSGGAILSDHSGSRPYGPDGVQVSFGVPVAQEIDAGATIDVLAGKGAAEVVPWIDRWLLDHSLMSGGFSDIEALALPGFGAFGFLGDSYERRGEYTEAWHMLNRPAAQTNQVSQVLEWADSAGWAPEPWPERLWGVAGVAVESDATI